MGQRKTEKRINRALEKYDLASGREKQTLTSKAIFLKETLYRDEIYKVLAVLDCEAGDLIDRKFNL